MRSPFATRLLLPAILLPLIAWATDSRSAPALLTLDQYVQTLDDSLATLRRIKDSPQEAGKFLDSLPSAWHVAADGKQFDIPTESIRHGLSAWQSKSGAESLEPVLQRLETLRLEAEAYQKPVPDFSAQRVLRNDILSRREFHNVHGQTWLDRLKQKLQELLIKLLGRAFSSSVIPVISDIFVYGLIFIAVIVAAYWMYRSLREAARVETIMPVAMPVSAKEWPIWMAEAREAAARGEWRDAIHLAYWAGISFLEAQGAWRPDLARTPREYLRLLPSTSQHHPTLRELTMRLEGVWYGMGAAGAEGFEATIGELERLGCPCR